MLSLAWSQKVGTWLHACACADHLLLCLSASRRRRAVSRRAGCSTTSQLPQVVPWHPLLPRS